MDIRDRTNDFFRQSSENGLELREGQAEMADEVSMAIEDHVPLAVEAEVGTGKSYAYLIPAVIKFSEDNQQTAIATSTIALQEQLYKDAQNVLKMLNVDVDIVIAKGMRNYICKHRLRVLLKKNKEDTLLQKIWKAVIEDNQDRSDLCINIPPELWGMICVKNYGNEHCHICDHTTSCQYHQIRKKIRSGRNIVICNQNMLISHYLHEKGIFNQNCSTFIIDEAHDIEGKFREAYTESYSRADMIRTINRCAENTPYQKRKLTDTLVGSIGITIQKLYEELVKQVHKKKKEIDEESKAYDFVMTKAVAGYVSELHRKFQRFERFTHVNTSETQEFLYNILYPAEHIIWIEDGTEIRLCICPKDIRRKISLLLFAKGDVILTSATISDKHRGTTYERCGYYLDSIGFPAFGRVSEPKRSPFDYDKNTIMYCSAVLPHPRKKEEYRKASIDEIAKLLEVTNGKTLILFTSKTDMEYVYKRLSNCHEDIAKLLKESAVSVLSGLADNEIQSIEKRLKEIDKARNDFVDLIATGACGADSLDNEFAQLFAEEEKLSEKLLALRSQNQVSAETHSRLENELREIENTRFELDRFNDVIIRKVIECIKVLSKTEILIIFKGGFEVKTEIEK